MWNGQVFKTLISHMTWFFGYYPSSNFDDWQSIAFASCVLRFFSVSTYKVKQSPISLHKNACNKKHVVVYFANLSDSSVSQYYCTSLVPYCEIHAAIKISKYEFPYDLILWLLSFISERSRWLSLSITSYDFPL